MLQKDSSQGTARIGTKVYAYWLHNHGVSEFLPTEFEYTILDNTILTDGIQ
jgi:hypothetical protein